MPVYNEQDNLETFVKDIYANFSNITYKIIIVNDCSTDNTFNVIKNLKSKKFPIEIISNDRNAGHGKSMLLGIRKAICFDCEFVLTVDGDGNIDVAELGEMFKFFSANKNSVDIVEGIRLNRKDPWFRRFVSWITRILIFILSGKKTNDANTPIRIYKKDTLKLLNDLLPQNSLIPNFRISILTRVFKQKVMPYKINTLIRNSSNSSGTTWGQKTKNIPSKKFIQFCVKAGLEVLMLFVNTKKYRRTF